MHDHIRFETPENVVVTYQPAGLGTRFIAWFIDNVLQFVIAFALFMLLSFLAIASEGVLRDVFRDAEAFDVEDPADVDRIGLYFVGLFMVAWGLGAFLYFGLFEFLMGGQTPGKRAAGIRVVSANGFALEGGGVLIRNVFRLVDQLPPLWVVPVLSAKGQRLGDMAAGTVVVADRVEELSGLRERLGGRPPGEARFQFAGGALKRARPEDVQAVERILERWPELDASRRDLLLERVVRPLAERLEVDPPAPAERLAFLEDYLAAEYRRQSRLLG